MLRLGMSAEVIWAVAVVCTAAVVAAAWRSANAVPPLIRPSPSVVDTANVVRRKAYRRPVRRRGSDVGPP